MQSKPIYVLDTNIIIDYPNIIPNGEIFIPDEPTIDLSKAHIVIPTAVIRELSKFKTETNTDRGRTAREVLRKLRDLFENNGISLSESYNCDKPITYKNSQQAFSILPVKEQFLQSAPFQPSADDVDGQIIIATMAIILKQEEMRNDLYGFDLSEKDVTLLTNDNGLAIRATSLGIKTSRYGYIQPKAYTGRRDVVVSAELFEEFWNSGRIELSDWNEALPKEPKLIANEFIVMETDPWPNDFDYNSVNIIGRYDAEEEAIVKLKYAYNFPVHVQNHGQAMLAESLMSPDIPVVICTGPAGTGKTFLSAIYALDAVKSGKYIGISVVPCGHEKDHLGALPGDIEEKLDPYVQPIKNAIRNYLLKTDNKTAKAITNLKKFGTDNKEGRHVQDDGQSKKSIKESLEDRVNLDYQNWFGKPVPIDFARGRDFSHEIAIYDEFQDQNFRQADTLIKRLGEDGKIIITGDIEQIHAAYLDRENNGIVYASRILKDSSMVARVSLTEEEVVRHPLVRLIAERQKSSPSV